jgi:hypothetical protein
MESASFQTCDYTAETRGRASAFSRCWRHLRTRQSVCSISRSIDAGRNGGRRLAMPAAMARNVRANLNTAGLLVVMRRYSPVLVRRDVLRSTGPSKSVDPENIRREPPEKQSDRQSSYRIPGGKADQAVFGRGSCCERIKGKGRRCSASAPDGLERPVSMRLGRLMSAAERAVC